MDDWFWRIGETYKTVIARLSGTSLAAGAHSSHVSDLTVVFCCTVSFLPCISTQSFSCPPSDKAAETMIENLISGTTHF